MQSKQKEIQEIERLQELYVDELIEKLNDSAFAMLKEINFTSDTGTGKTNMMALLINKLSDKFFIITSLSKGQLSLQIKDKLSKLCKFENFKVFGVSELKSNTKLTKELLLDQIPEDKDVYWIRDEGHITTNKWSEALEKRALKIINFSATNNENYGVKTNFVHTMMLRTVKQNIGTPEEALDKLLEVKKLHESVKNYNPCAIIRCINNDDLEKNIIELCKKKKLKYISLIDNDDYIMSELCKDDNEYDVIVNKFKIVEGIDIRRAHVLYMNNEPSNVKTTIQMIGRCRRNALFWRNDIDICSEENKKLLENTRNCYIYYNIKGMSINEDADGNLCQSFCDIITCELLKVDSEIEVNDGVLSNGLKVIELEGQTGNFKIVKDENTGFNIIENYKELPFYTYTTKKVDYSDMVFISRLPYKKQDIMSLELLKNKTVYEFNSNTCSYTAVGKFDGYNINSFKKISKLFIKKYDTELFINYLNSFTLNNEIHIKKHKNFYYVMYYPQYEIRDSIFEYEYDRSLLQEYRLLNSYNNSILFDEMRDILYLVSEYTLENHIASKAFDSKKDAKEFKKYLLKRGQNRFLIPENLNSIDDFYVNVRVRDIKPANIPAAICHLNDDITESLDMYYISKKEDPDPKDHYDYGYSFVLLKDINTHFIKSYVPFTKIYNDSFTSIIGTDLMRSVGMQWTEDSAVTKKVSVYSKLNKFICTHYNNEIQNVKKYLFKNKNSFDFDKKCNSCLGYCVEYYAKYLIYGDSYLQMYMQSQRSGSRGNLSASTYAKNYDLKARAVRACMNKYRENMKYAFGEKVGAKIPSISIERLVNDNNKNFIDTVIILGEKTANFIKSELNIIDKLEEKYDPNLSVQHISALVDFLTDDTIIDIKCTNSITESHIRQVLAYHYLSTKRSDLHIKRVIVYDAVSGKSVKIDLSNHINNKFL